MFGGVEWESRDVVGKNGVSNEATSGVGKETDHEEECKMMGIPESLEALLTNFVVRGGIHEQQDQKHEMTRYSSRLCIVDLKSCLLPHLYKSLQPIQCVKFWDLRVRSTLKKLT